MHNNKNNNLRLDRPKQSLEIPHESSFTVITRQVASPYKAMMQIKNQSKNQSIINHMLIMIWTWTDLDVKYEFTAYLPSLTSMINRTVRAVPKINTSIHSPQVHQMFDTIIQPFQIQRQMGNKLFRVLLQRE